MNIEISENFYFELTAMTIDPKIELEKLSFHSIVNLDEKYGIVWFKDIFASDGKFYAKVELRISVDTHEEAVGIMNELAEHLKIKGMKVKRSNNP